MKPINVGLLGIGTVGGGTWNVLARNREEIQRRAGREIRISVVADKDVEKARRLTAGAAQVVADGNDVVGNREVDIVVELIGGYTVAKDLVLKAIANGKHVVTANKAMLATHGNEIFAAAQAKGVIVAFEAAVAGGVPIIKALREGLTANHIEWIAGIINGTSNFILSEMRERGLPFDEVLREAQARGYAEADPTFDIAGIDAAHKLTILAAIAFGIPMQLAAAYTEGIAKLTREDIRYAESLGYRIKLLGITKRAPDARPGAAVDRGRRRGDERDPGERRCGRGDHVLRRGRRCGSDRERRRRGSGGRHAAPHRGPRASRPAPRLPVRPAGRHAHPADGRGGDLLLPAHARARSAGGARRHHPDPR